VYEDVARKYRGEIGGRNPGLDNEREREREREIYICKEVK
jgi:hypothetical protein